MGPFPLRSTLFFLSSKDINNKVRTSNLQISNFLFFWNVVYFFVFGTSRSLKLTLRSRTKMST